jgi:hypothetical protein
MQRTIRALLLTVLTLVGACEVAEEGSVPAEQISSQQQNDTVGTVSCCAAYGACWWNCPSVLVDSVQASICQTACWTTYAACMASQNATADVCPVI